MASEKETIAFKFTPNHDEDDGHDNNGYDDVKCS